MTEQHDLKSIGKTLLESLKVEPSDLGEALSELKDIVIDCLERDSSNEAFQCCKTALALCNELKPEVDLRSNLKTSHAQAVFYAYMGTSYLNQEKLEPAIACYRESRKLFHSKLRPDSRKEGLLWITIGKLCQYTGELEEAFFAFQQSLFSFRAVTSDSGDTSDFVAETQAELKKTGQLLRNSLSKDKQRNPTRAKPPDVKPANIVMIPLVAKIAAGPPILAEENIEDYLALDKNYVKDATFALQVQGNSLINAAIRDKDVVLIRAQPVANNGDIVAVILTEIEDEATLKRYYQEDSLIRLQPENDAEKTIIILPRRLDVDPVKAEYQRKGVDVHVMTEVKVEIVGKVVGVLRTY